MIVLLSPSKTQSFSSVENNYISSTKPRFIKSSIKLIETLQKLNIIEIAELMNVSKSIAELNYLRFQKFDFKFNNNINPAILAFKGDVYTHINVNEYSEQNLDFAQKHLRIISGLYGLLRPFDLIQAYRLEMKTKLNGDSYSDLYYFWGDKITDLINQDLKELNQNIVVNLASKEYFNAINVKKLNAKIINIIFKEYKAGKYKIIAVYAKQARGMMANFIVQNSLIEVEHLKNFNQNGYKYNIELSSSCNYVFTR